MVPETHQKKSCNNALQNNRNLIAINPTIYGILLDRLRCPAVKDIRTRRGQQNFVARIHCKNSPMYYQSKSDGIFFFSSRDCQLCALPVDCGWRSSCDPTLSVSLVVPWYHLRDSSDKNGRGAPKFLVHVTRGIAQFAVESVSTELRSPDQIGF
jgi:hypothetical protein